MADSKLTYEGPLKALSGSRGSGTTGRRRRVPWVFLIVVALPTLISAAYFLMFATPRYVSDARFIVRSPAQEGPNALGVALQGVGLGASQSDAFAVQEYISSRQAVDDLQARMNFRGMLARSGDALFRFPRLGEGDSREDLFKASRRFIDVGYDSTNGISTLRVRAFAPRDAQAVADALLDGGEQLVNKLNQRAADQAVTEGQRTIAEAEARLTAAQIELTAFRNREGFIDPTVSAAESAEVIGSLLSQLAPLRAEYDQLSRNAPQSPQLPSLTGRIAAYERQIATERAKIAGGAAALAPRVTDYERLEFERELAARALASANTALNAARTEARQQQLYLERVVAPNLPDKATEPQALRGVFTIFLSCLLAYGIGWLVWAGVREHQQP